MQRTRSFVAGVVGVGMMTTGAMAQQAVQWRVEDRGNGHWYARTTQVFAHFSVARTYAEARGGHLVTLTSASENSYVAALAPGESILGGYQDRFASDYVEPAGGWRWITGEPWQFSSWRAGEPNNGSWPDERGEHYLVWWRYSNDHESTWNDGGNDMTVPPWNAPWNLPATIEWSADCNNDGLVDYGQILSGQLTDTNNNGVPDICEAPPCPGDITGNRVVNGIDLAAILAAWGGGKSQFDCDIDNDGVVGGSDLAIVLAGWGACP